MSSRTKRLVFAAAALAIATGVASAQALNVSVPFAFRLGHQIMAPGDYRVVVGGGNQLVTISNFAAKQSAAILPNARTDAAKEWRAAGAPVLAFECGASRCALTQLWAGGESPALSIPHRSPGGEAVLTLIRMVRVHGK
jgi:hypothetical protein